MAKASFSTPDRQSTPQHGAAVSEQSESDAPWVTIVWNDPVNLMSYVVYVFQAYFGYKRPRAEKLMQQVHSEGKAVVSSGTREQAERDTAAMHGYGLWATFVQDGGSRE